MPQAVPLICQIALAQWGLYCVSLMHMIEPIHEFIQIINTVIQASYYLPVVNIVKLQLQVQIEFFFIFVYKK